MSGENEEKKIYIVELDSGEDISQRCVKLTEEQYKAMQWLLDKFDGAEVSDLCIWKLDEFEPEEIE